MPLLPLPLSVLSSVLAVTSAMDSRVEGHGLRNVATMNAKPAMFQAGLSTKFTKRHVANFHDTTLTAASAAKARAELKMERQANAIEKQQQKIEHEMKKIEAITEKLQRQQAREAKRLRQRLTFAATRIQRAFRSHVVYVRTTRDTAAIEIQRHWRGRCGRQYAMAVAYEQAQCREDAAARVITRCVRRFACREAVQHELAWHDYAATAIQSIVRRFHAKHEASSRRHARETMARRERAAICIQSHIRGFLTRVVYMDVLYLVCRIQSVVRGFLVRTRLRSLLSLNVHAIVAFQARVRGVLIRRHVTPKLEQLKTTAQRNDTPPRRRSHLGIQTETRRRATRPRDIVSTSPSRQVTYALAAMAATTAPAPSPPRIQRSYWLPSGANTGLMNARPVRHRLPQLPIRNAPLESPTRVPETMSFDDAALHAVTIQRMIRGQLAKRKPPVRLEPLQIPRDDTEEQERLKRERQELLKRKLVARRASEKKRLELDLARRQQQEMEDAERKLMEREEKRTRLVIKTTQRKHEALERRRQTLEQEREEKERLEMVREERYVRLYLKRLERSTNLPRRASQQRDAADFDTTDDSGAKDQRDQDEKRQLKATRVVRPTIPQPIKPPKQRSRTKPPKPSDHALKKTSQLRAVYGKSANQASVDRLQAQYASWDFHTDEDFANEAELVEDDAEFDYGNDFDDVVDETTLARLLC